MVLQDPRVPRRRDAGAEVQGERVRFPRGLARQIVQASAPATFIQEARNPERNVRIGGPYTVLAPSYGTPFVRDLDLPVKKSIKVLPRDSINGKASPESDPKKTRDENSHQYECVP